MPERRLTRHLLGLQVTLGSWPPITDSLPVLAATRLACQDLSNISNIGPTVLHSLRVTSHVGYQPPCPCGEMLTPAGLPGVLVSTERSGPESGLQASIAPHELGDCGQLMGPLRLLSRR